MRDHRLKLLGEKGYRVTLPRQEILKALRSRPQSAKEIYEKLNNNAFAIDLATVYRTLAFFFSEGVITKTQLDTKTIKYEFNDNNNHHHHLICEKCGEIRNVSVDDESFLKMIIDKTNFSVKRHTLDLWGLCSKCR